MIEVIKFSSTWCQPCKVYDPIFDKVGKSMSGISFRKIDVDIDSDLTLKYNIKSVPTTIVLNNGEEINRFSGVRSDEQLITIIKSIIS